MFRQLRNKIHERTSFIPVGVWVAILMALLVGGQWVWKEAHHPRDLDAIAEESGNLNFMLENETPQISHDGERLLFCHSTEKGMGVFIADTATGQKKLVFEEAEIHFGLGPHGVLAPFSFSPDDRWFVYAHQGPGAVNEELALPQETALTICRADTDEAEATLVAPFGRVVALQWLTTNTFVYVDGTEGHDFMLVRRGENGTWQQSRLDTPTSVPPPHRDNHFCGLAAVSSDTIIWLQADRLWRMNVVSLRAEKLCDLPADQFFMALDYAPATGQLLLSAVGSREDSLWQMPLGEPGALRKVVSEAHTHDNLHDVLWNDARWLEGGRGYAFIRKPGLTTSGLVLKTANLAKPMILFSNDYIQYFVPEPDDRKMLVVGDINHLPGSAIWECDFRGGLRRCVVPGSDSPLKRLKHVPIRYEMVRISAREHLRVVVFPPVDLDRIRKHPVVIGNIRFVVEDPYLYQYPEAVANAGGWFLMIDHTWSSKSLESWAWHLGNLAEFVVNQPQQFPGVDRRQIYVLSNSAQSRGLPALFTNFPGLFYGAILQAPGSVYEPARWATAPGHPVKVLVTAESGYPSASYLQRYQAAAAGVGMEMDWIIHPDTPHEFIAKKSQRARIGAMLHFIFDE